MEEKQILTDEELKQVNGGARVIPIDEERSALQIL